VPAFIPLIGMLGNLGRAGLGAYRTMRAIRAARAAKGMPMGYQRMLGSQGAGLGKGTSGSGLQGLVARGAKKAPGTSGSLEAGTGVLLGGEGVGDIVQGTREGDVGQTLMGIGSLAFGAPLVGKGLRLAGSQRTLKRKFPETSKAMQTTGKEFTKRVPGGLKGTTGVGLAGIGGGLVLGDKPPAVAEEIKNSDMNRIISDKPVDLVISTIESDKKNPEIDTTTPEYKKLATEALTKAYQQQEIEGTTSSATADRIADVMTFTTPGGTKVNNTATMPNNKDPEAKDLDVDDINDIANRQNAQGEGGKAIIDNLSDGAGSEEAAQFNRFYDRITNLTGGNDQTNNLILFKLGTGLMKGRTSQGGLRGFVDVLGQAGSDTADLAMALFQKEKDRRNDLAVAYLKAKEKKKTDAALKVKSRKTVVVQDPTSPFGAKSVEVGVDQNGFDVMIVDDGQGGTTAVPMKYTEYTEVNKSPARIDKRRKQLGSINAGYQMTQEILALPEGTFGAGGKVRLGFENLVGSLESIANTLNIRNIGSFDEEVDGIILNDYIGGKKIDEQGNEVALTEKEREDTAKLQAEYRKEIGTLNKNFRPDDKDLANITKARLIEIRMKYILANALKDEDRLTRADIEDAAQATQTLGLGMSDRVVRGAYERLAERFQAQFKRVGRDFIELGGSVNYLNSFEDMPIIREYQKSLQNKIIKQNIAANNTAILGTIK
jgi:hypothetical protein